MPAGRPRTSTPPPDEMIALGEEMIAWVIKNKPLHLSHWWSVEKFITSKVWETMMVAPEFFPYYEHALRIIGLQYLDKTSNVRDSISHRWQRVYFKDLKQEEDEQLKFESQLKIKEFNAVNEEDKQRTDAVIELIKEAQKAYSERAKADKSSNTDIKS